MIMGDIVEAGTKSLDIVSISSNWADTLPFIINSPGLPLNFTLGERLFSFQVYPWHALEVEPQRLAKAVRRDHPKQGIKRAHVEKILSRLDEGQAVPMITARKTDAFIIRDSDKDLFKIKQNPDLVISANDLAARFPLFATVAKLGGLITVHDSALGREYMMYSFPQEDVFRNGHTPAVRCHSSNAAFTARALGTAMQRLRNSDDFFTIETESGFFRIDLLKPGEDLRREHQSARRRASETAGGKVSVEREHSLGFKDYALNALIAQLGNETQFEIDYLGSTVLILSPGVIPDNATLSGNFINTERFCYNEAAKGQVLSTALAGSFTPGSIKRIRIYHNETGQPLFAMATEDLKEIIQKKEQNMSETDTASAEPETREPSASEPAVNEPSEPAELEYINMTGSPFPSYTKYRVINIGEFHQLAVSPKTFEQDKRPLLVVEAIRGKQVPGQFRIKQHLAVILPSAQLPQDKFPDRQTGNGLKQNFRQHLQALEAGKTIEIHDLVLVSPRAFVNSTPIITGFTTCGANDFTNKRVGLVLETLETGKPLLVVHIAGKTFRELLLIKPWDGEEADLTQLDPAKFIHKEMPWSEFKASVLPDMLYPFSLHGKRFAVISAESSEQFRSNFLAAQQADPELAVETVVDLPAIEVRADVAPDPVQPKIPPMATEFLKAALAAGKGERTLVGEFAMTADPREIAEIVDEWTFGTILQSGEEKPLPEIVLDPSNRHEARSIMNSVFNDSSTEIVAVKLPNGQRIVAYRPDKFEI